jgi:hypothetical protein
MGSPVLSSSGNRFDRDTLLNLQTSPTKPPLSMKEREASDRFLLYTEHFLKNLNSKFTEASFGQPKSEISPAAALTLNALAELHSSSEERRKSPDFLAQKKIKEWVITSEKHLDADLYFDTVESVTIGSLDNSLSISNELAITLFRRLHNLQKVQIINCPNLTDEIFEVLVDRCNSLTAVELIGPNFVTDLALAYLANSNNLESIRLESNTKDIVPLTERTLLRATKLMRLQLKHFSIKANFKLNDFAMQNILKNCSNLQSLSIKNDLLTPIPTFTN